jgi:PAS domain S-box-containing protein
MASRPFDADGVMQAYGIATLSVLGALAALTLMEGAWNVSTPAAVFLVAVVLSAGISGARAAALTLVLSLIAYTFLYLPAVDASPDAQHIVRLVSLVVVAGYVVWLAATNRARTRSLREAGDELRLAIDTIPAMTWTVLPDGRMEFLNRRWLEYSGLTLAEGLQQPLQTVHPDDQARVLDEWGKHMAKGEGYEAEMRLRRDDGAYRWFLVRTVPLLDEKGKVLKWYGTSTDIEERRQAAAAVQEKQRLLESMLETLPVGVAILDPVGDIVLINAASRRIWGGGEAILSGTERWKRSKGFWHGSGRALAPGEWASALALSEGKTVLNQMIDIENFDGQRRTVQNSAVPLRNSAGTVVGAVVVHEDVTDRLEADKAVRESADHLQHLSRRLFAVQEEERRHLSRELHDEFGQLLSAISLHLQVAKGASPSAASASLDECTGLVQRAGERVRGLALELRPTMLESAGLDGTLRWLAEQHSRQGKISVSVSGRVGEIPNHIAITAFRVMQEALTNVLRHAQAQRVIITLEQDGARLRVGIEDDGVGFDVGTTREQAAARGHLGLIGMKERVDIHGGELQITSQGGSGTRIRASLPLPPAL